MGSPNDAKINPDSWAERNFRSLVMSAQELRCLCIPDDPYYLDPLTKLEWEWLPGEGKWKYFVKVCVKCKRPPRYALSIVLHNCEGCERYYVPERLPDKHGLCGVCAAKIPSRPKRRRP